MNRVLMFSLFLLLVIARPIKAQQESLTWSKDRATERSPEFQRVNIPYWVTKIAQEKKLMMTYDLSLTKNPFYLNGDFNGDCRTDIAIWIEHRKTHELGILVVHYETAQTYILGAGHKFGNGGSDFQRLTNWHVHQKGKVERGVEEREIELRGDAIYVEAYESASALIYWDGKGYSWYQLGD